MSAIDKTLGLRGRVGVVTGGSRGLGRAVVLCLARMGVHVVINYLSDRASAEAVRSEAETHGVRALIVRADMRRKVDAEKLIKETIGFLGGLDILVCNAGVWVGAPIEDMDEEAWTDTLDVNLKGTWTACRAAVPYLKEGHWGRIVIVSSTAGQRGEADYSGYAASKGGQIAFAKSLAVELAPYGVTVNAIAPGWVETQMTAEFLAVKGARRRIEGGIPIGRVASPEDVALPILFLCSEWARHITGEVLNVNGGSVLCG